MRAIGMLQVVLAAGLAAPVWGQTADSDGPGRGVARISLINGDVSVRRGDSGDVIAAGVNAPLVVQDRILTGVSSRAEVQFDWANFLRVAADAEVRLAELEQNRYLVQVARGTITWRVLRDTDAYVEISTPSVSVRPVRKGTYRISVHQDGTSEISVRSGEAEVFTPRGSERIKSGRSLAARGTASDPEYRVVAEIPEDEWDRWNNMRDRDLQNTRSYQYMSRDIYGAEDLDHHGTWVYAPSYGWVWSPRVAVGWAPYRYGRWAWVDWYGWSWVSYDPWGWAPYHYGRWFHHGSHGWCWWPGPMRARYRWSPGIVAFFGFGGGVGVNVGFGWGRVGWVPLAPWEPFTPWWGSRWYGGYRHGDYGYNNVTIVNNVNIRNVYRNARIDHGVTVVDQDGFRRGRLGDSVRLNGDEFRSASMARGPVPVTPERTSLRFSDRDAAVRTVAAREPDRFFSNRQPTPVQRLSFDEQRRGMEQMSRSAAAMPRTETGTERGTRGTVEQRGWRTAAPAAAPEARTGETRGWRTIGETPRGATPARTSSDTVTGPRSADSEWRRFGSTRAAEATADPGRGGRGTGEPAAARSQMTPGSDAPRGAGSEWRRFGSARATEATTDTGRSGRSFGEPAAPRSDLTPRGGSDNWRRFGTGSGARVESGDSSWRRGTSDARTFERTPEPLGSSGRSSGRQWSDSPRSEPSGRFGSMERGESIRISPPIVRERTGDFGGMRGGGSMGGARSAPGGDAAGMRGGSSGGGRMGDGGGSRGSGGAGGGSRGGRGR